MRKYLSNCNGTMGVITRAKARASSAAASLSLSSMAVKKMKKASDKRVRDIRNRRRFAVVSDENFRSKTAVVMSSSDFSSSEVVVVVETTMDRTGGVVVSADLPASCCSSNDNASIYNNIVVDPVESAETMSSRHSNLNIYDDEERIESKMKTIESEDLDSPMRSVGRKSSVQIKMPSDLEIDTFFAAAEKDLQKRFTDRYNFDVVKDVPLEGRYEWVPINQAINSYK